jgi:DNA polymerase-3 subunit beta
MQHVASVVPFSPVMPPDTIASLSQTEILSQAATAMMDEAAEREAAEAAEKAEQERLLAIPPFVTETTCSALVNRAELAAAVATACRAVERNSTIPILSNVLLKAEAGGVVVEGTDLDVVIRVQVPGAADAKFSTTVPAHKLSDILKKAKASEMVAFDIKRVTTESYRDESQWLDGKMRTKTVKHRQTDEHNALDFDGLRVKLNGLPPSDFPELKGPTERTDKDEKPLPFSAFTLPTADFVRALSKTQFAISTEETRYYLNGVYMHVAETHGHGGKVLRFVATDGNRLAQVDLPVPSGAADMPGVIIPRKTVGELLRLAKAKHAPQSVGVWVGNIVSEFHIGTAVVRTKHIDGTFPDYGRVIPLQNDKVLTISRDALAEGIKQVSCLSSERGRAVKFSIRGDRVRLTVVNPDTGSAETDVPGDFVGDDLDIGFNANYVTDILSHCDSDTVAVKLSDPGSPALIEGNADSDAGTLFVLMPMRV